jgi:hypothetical protein
MAVQSFRVRKAPRSGKNGMVAHAQLMFGNGMIMFGSARDGEFGRWVKPLQEIGGRDAEHLHHRG